MNDVYKLPELSEVTPLVLITGFLGAGKTTLLRELLIAIRGAELESDVILNDYADANLDSATLEELATSIEPLTAVCACCEGFDFLLEMAVKSADSDSDLLFIELNGTADPVPIVEAFALLEEKMKRHPRWQICVINPQLFGSREGYADIENLQLQTASHVYFSHTDEGSASEEVIAKIRAVNPEVSILTNTELKEMVVSALSLNPEPRF